MNMQQTQPFSYSAKDYLDTFSCILETMIQGMTEAEVTESISRNFIVQMIPHHEAAIQMSHNILKYTRNPELRTIASGIVSEQTRSIEQMCSIEGTCSRARNSRNSLCRYRRQTERIMNRMFCRMRSARATNSMDCDFMWEMIPHHEGAIGLSKTTLQYPICPDLVPILNAIISSQERGVMQMQRLLRCINC